MEKNKFSKLEISLLSLNAIENMLGGYWSHFPKSPGLQDYPLKFILYHGLILELSKFIEEYKKYLVPALKEENKEWVLQILKPLLDPIMEESDNIKLLRNRSIAHPYRDQRGNFSPAIRNIVNRNMKTNFAEFIFLTKCAWHYCRFLRSYLPDEVKSAKDKFKIEIDNHETKSEQLEKGQIQTLIQVDEKITRLIKIVRENEKRISSNKE